MKSQIISLIGMPATGKSTVAHALAKTMQCKFFDLDVMVEEETGMALIKVLQDYGSDYFLSKECGYLQELDVNTPAIIATPGSLIYHPRMVSWIIQNTYCVLLKTDFEVLAARLAEKPKAVVGLKEKGLEKLYAEHMPLYEEIADIEIETAQKTPEELGQDILNSFSHL
jgi:shikimate kinase